MPETFVKIFISFAILSLVGLSIIGFAGKMGLDNNANQTILDNSFINKTFIQLGGNITSAGDTANAQREAVEREQVEIPEGSFLLVSVVGTAKKFGDIMVGNFNLIFLLIFTFLGFAASVLIVLGTIYVAKIIFAGWKTFKTGT